MRGVRKDIGALMSAATTVPTNGSTSATTPPAPGDPFRGDPMTAGTRYAEFGWPVVPTHGLHAEPNASAEYLAWRCGCGSADCPTPGAHPALDGWRTAATTDPRRVEELWLARPGGVGVVLPAGVAAIDVPALVGMTLLEHLGRRRPIAPVADGLGRMRFFVRWSHAGCGDLPGFAEWRSRGVDLRVRCPGAFVPLPPCGRGTRFQIVWTIAPEPTEAGELELPEATHLGLTVLSAVREARPDLWYDQDDDDPDPFGAFGEPYDAPDDAPDPDGPTAA
jgi:hypothetical protein